MTQAAALRADALLDRRLMQARVPQVPSGLAARIVSEATRLPQQRPPAPMLAPVVSAAPAASSSRIIGNWLQAASVAALLLVSAGTATILRSGGETETAAPAAALAEAGAIAAPVQLAVQDVSTPQAPAAPRKAERMEQAVAAQNAAGLAAIPVIEDAAPPALSAPEPRPVLAKAATTWSLPSAPEQVYGPVATPSGMGYVGGIYGSGSAPSGMGISGGLPHP